MEDELHFLFECKTYQQQRLKLYDRLPELPHESQPINRLKILNHYPYAYGNYIDELWKERNNKLKMLMQYGVKQP